jgi:hypothetical protein
MPRRVLCALSFSGALWACGTESIELAPSSAEVEPPGTVETPEVAGQGGSAAPGAVPPGMSSSPGLDTPPSTVLVPGCKAVDFLFVVDNSLSMVTEQSNLTLSFPRFIEIAQSTLEAKDFHIMAVTTDGARAPEGSAPLDAAACDGVLGAGRRRSSGGEDCRIEGGLAFMTGEQPNLAETFSCAARVGTFGNSDSEPMQAMLAAVSPALNAEAGCNSGFFRDDAVLVVVFISDEEDEDSPGDPEEWHRLLLDAKGGNEDALVVLGLIGDNNIEGGLPGGPCNFFAADAAPRLQQFVSNFARRGLAGSVCALSYASFFEQAVSWIDSACTEFVLPR